MVEIVRDNHILRIACHVNDLPLDDFKLIAIQLGVHFILQTPWLYRVAVGEAGKTANGVV